MEADEESREAKESFEKIIKGYVDTGVRVGTKGVKCKCCDEVFTGITAHRESVYCKRRTACIELYRQLDQIKYNRNFQSFQEIRNILGCPASDIANAKPLLSLSAWRKNCSGGSNQNRTNLDGARIWFKDFIVTIEEICKEILREHDDNDLRPKPEELALSTVSQIQEILLILSTLKPEKETPDSARTRSQVNSGRVSPAHRTELELVLPSFGGIFSHPSKPDICPLPSQEHLAVVDGHGRDSLPV
jgi:hypothetical protein